MLFLIFVDTLPEDHVTRVLPILRHHSHVNRFAGPKSHIPISTSSIPHFGRLGRSWPLTTGLSNGAKVDKINPFGRVVDTVEVIIAFSRKALMGLTALLLRFCLPSIWASTLSTSWPYSASSSLSSSLT